MSSPETEAGGPPDGSRHAPPATCATSMVAELDDVLLAAAELADDLAGQRRREEQAYHAGYRDGFSGGDAVGAARAERELTETWASVAEHVHDLAGMPSHAELEQHRAAPGGDAYYATLIRNGGTEFGGVGRPRVPAPADAYRAALAWAQQSSERAA